MARGGTHFILTNNNIIFLKPDELKSRHWQWVKMNPTGRLARSVFSVARRLGVQVSIQLVFV